MKKNKIWKITLVLLVVVFTVISLRPILFASYIVDGKSMEPTLHDGNLLMVNKVIYNLAEADRFDVIVFHANKREDYVKRVIGLPGDQIEYKNDKLYINGKYMEEEFLKFHAKASNTRPFTENFTLEEITGETTVPDGQLFVMGDNRQDSLDSRSFGFVSIEQLVGKVDAMYWPISEMSLGLGK
ncbi:signal peptidase I [Oceanobacillus chungangensis]|uniref:Signal peptidase I n=1 Tax=Oceanobacillus chungangensis TaxID=1229152 RepID=A0A3D8PVY9_9BACI|nr:signal peptidase I [Oceanobacillus chungangensis]RDW19922.1 signal peptidase I [Oceanobacillus chungangensis]